MNLVIPFTKDIKFKSSIGEILSVSLEHDYTANMEEVLGNFTVSGEYKTHEVSVNKESFEYVLPFSVNLTSKIDTESVSFEVEDFTYELIDNDTMRVNIEYSIKATEIKEEPLFKEIEDEELDDILKDITTLERIEAENANVKEESTPNETKNVILDNIKKDEEEVYVTYRIHEVKENDTIESICTKYNVLESTLKEYNDLSTLSLLDKIIIPDINE